MSRLAHRLRLVEQRTARQRTTADWAVSAALARLSVSELEALESALVAQQEGRALDDAQRAALKAWERVAPHDAA